nr:hypothetical protein BaRGS_018536 [Batillaria attramentaria]
MPFDMVVAGQCARIRVLEKVEPPPCTIILYTTNLVDGFKRQFYSVPDHRYSAVLIGSVGVISISVVVLGVLLLDSATILTHLKQLANNVRAFKARKH